MLETWIQDKYLDASFQKNLKKSFQKAKPYRHLVLKDFFKEKGLLKFKAAVLKEKFERKDIDLFSFHQTNELFSSKNETIQLFYGLFSSKDFSKLISKLTGEKLGKIDMHAHLYKQGDYLLFHDDVVEGRKIAYALNLSSGFSEKDGGKLQMYDVKNPEKPAKEIIPAFNSLVIFQVSEKSLHAVEEIKSDKIRLSVGGWFYGH